MERYKSIFSEMKFSKNSCKACKMIVASNMKPGAKCPNCNNPWDEAPKKKPPLKRKESSSSFNTWNDKNEEVLEENNLIKSFEQFIDHFFNGDYEMAFKHLLEAKTVEVSKWVNDIKKKGK